MPIEGCPDFATAEELQELRNQLNAVLGEKEDGGKIDLFKKGEGTAALATAAGFTLFGMAKTNAPKVITDIVLEAPGAKSIWKELANGTAKLIGFKGNGSQLPLTDLSTVGKTAGTGAAGATVAAGAASTAAAAMSVLMSLVSIAASLGLNIATTKVLGGRMDAEIAGINIQMDAINAGMIRLYEKNQGDINAANAEIAQNEVLVEQNRIQIVTNAALIQQAESQNTNLSFEIESANTAIQELQARNNQLRSELENSNIDIAEINDSLTTHINDIETRLTEAANIVTKQQETITKQGEEIELLKARVTATELNIASLVISFQQLRSDFDLLKDDLTIDPDLADARSKLKSAQLIIAQNKVKNINIGGGSGSAAAGTAKAQKGILSLANNLAGSPITVPEISTSDINDRNSPFDQILSQLLPQINTSTMTPEQIADLKESLKVDFGEQLELGLKVGVIDSLTKITNQTSQSAIREGVEQGICSSLNGGGCSTPPGSPPTIQGLGGMNNALGGRIDLLNASLNTGLAGQNTAILNIVSESRSILKNPTFGLEAMQNFAAKAWKFTQADKIIAVANLMASTHNAAMLSRNLGQTLGDVSSQALTLFGIKAPDGSAIDVNSVLGNSISNLIKSVVGEEVYTDTSAKWKAGNRILTSASGVVYALRGAKEALLEAQEVVGGWVALIGNAHQDQGIVESNTYPWMNPKPDFRTPFKGFLTRVDNLEEVASSVNQLVGSGVEFQESVNETIESSTELTKALDDFSEEREVEQITSENSNKSPDINNSSLVKSQTN